MKENPHDKRDSAALIMGHPLVPPVRGTQSFVHTLTAVWKRPGVTGLEVAWRWVIGIPALWLVMTQLQKVLRAVTGGSMDPASLGLDKALLNDPVGALTADPMGAAGKFAHAIGMVLPGLEREAVWMLPLLFVGWVVVSSVGRTVMLRRYDPRLKVRVGTLVGLQGIRLAVLGGVCWVWFEVMGWAARVAVSGPIAAGADPNLIVYCAIVIVTTIGMFTVWAFVSWVLAMPPLLAMLNGTGVLGSLRAVFHLGELKGKLVEVNLVMGIVKIALLVLAMVFSACPLPFETVTTPGFLAWWWAGVGVLWVVWSDFFHVARLVGYLALWREYESR